MDSDLNNLINKLRLRSGTNYFAALNNDSFEVCNRSSETCELSTDSG